MDNLMNFESEQFDYNFFRSSDEEERKVHTPFIQPCQYALENLQNCKPISQKIAFNATDMVFQKKNKIKKSKTAQDSETNKKSGHWSSDENKRYHWFLQVHHQHFFKKHLRRTDRIFKSMATFVQTREAEQCRSHHQKMQKKYKFFSKILMNLRVQNYGCLDQEPLLEDMSHKLIDIKQEDIVSGDYLQNYQQNHQRQTDNEQHKQNIIQKHLQKQCVNTYQTLPFCIQQIQQNQQEEVCDSDRDNDNDNGYLQQYQREAKQKNKNDLDDMFNDTYEKNIQFHGFFE